MHTRRDFLSQSSKAAAASPLVQSTVSRLAQIAATTGVVTAATHAHAAGGEDIKIALIGCGGRGSGACNQALTAGSTIKLVALCDVLEGKAAKARQLLKDRHPAQVDVPDEALFDQLSDYKKVIALADVVLICTPPGPRPQIFEEAVRQGKHVFMEKPVASDAAGVRRVLKAAAEAKQKNLNVCVGLQRRYQSGYMNLVDRIHQGEIGDILYGRVYWNGTARAGSAREPGESELHYQIRNWYFFTWMSGDHILEQHVHNIDVAHWVMNALPVRATGQGGRQVRKDKVHGTIFDHHTVEFEYANGTRVLSQCCQIGGKCAKNVSEHFHGTKGLADMNDTGGLFQINGKDSRQAAAPAGDGKRRRGAGGIKEDGWQLEHDAFFANIRTGKVRNDAEYGAYSTLMGVMGRMATYTGQTITWEQALNSQDNLVPELLDWNTPAPVQPEIGRAHV